MRLIAAVFFLLLFGAAKLPVENSLTQEHRAAFFHSSKLNLGLRQQIGQLGFLAALSGFRASVADFLWIQAHLAWEKTQWGRMALLFNNVTALQPRALIFWDMSAWHMAWNASVAALNNPKQPRAALRLKAQHEYFKLGEDFLVRGIENNPDRYKLYESLGNLYQQKFQDHCAAAAQYKLAMQFANAPDYLTRFYGYELSYCPGHEREAYDYLLSLYHRGQNEWLPTLLTRIKFLEQKLNIPPEQRIPNTE